MYFMTVFWFWMARRCIISGHHWRTPGRNALALRWWKMPDLIWWRNWRNRASGRRQYDVGEDASGFHLVSFLVLVLLVVFCGSAQWQLSQTNNRMLVWNITVRQTNKLSLIIYNREQATNSHYYWPDENFPVTKLTGRNVSPASCQKAKKENCKG